MWDSRLVREIVSVLMESSTYFLLSLRERHSLVKHLMSLSLYGR